MARRGFGSMAPEKQRALASKGGKAAHQKGTGHEWTSEEARKAGAKGGSISRGGRGRLKPKASVPPPTTPVIADVDPDPDIVPSTPAADDNGTFE